MIKVQENTKKCDDARRCVEKDTELKVWVILYYFEAIHSYPTRYSLSNTGGNYLTKFCNLYMYNKYAIIW